MTKFGTPATSPGRAARRRRWGCCASARRRGADRGGAAGVVRGLARARAGAVPVSSCLAPCLLPERCCFFFFWPCGSLLSVVARRPSCRRWCDGVGRLGVGLVLLGSASVEVDGSFGGVAAGAWATGRRGLGLHRLGLLRLLGGGGRVGRRRAEPGSSVAAFGSGVAVRLVASGSCAAAPAAGRRSGRRPA